MASVTGTAAIVVLPEVIETRSEYIPGSIPEGCTVTDRVAGPVPDAGETASHGVDAAALHAVAAETGIETDCADGTAPPAALKPRKGGEAGRPFGCAAPANDAASIRTSDLMDYSGEPLP